MKARYSLIAFAMSLPILGVLFFQFKPSTVLQPQLADDMQVDNITPLDEIDFTYPNNWGSPELTHSSFKMQSGDRPCAVEGDDFTYLSPLPTISKYAGDTSIVMINESHSKSVHRVFIRDVIKALTKTGYNHYGSELFGKDTTAWLNSEGGLKGTGYLSTQKTGSSYWEDPGFGQVAEDLAKIDISFFSIEGDNVNIPPNVKSSIGYREKLQAENIARYAESTRNDKIIVHTGYHHIKEYDDSRYGPWMAERFKEMTDIDPLTISQTDCYGTEYFQDGHMGYAILADSNGVPISRNGYDLILVSGKEDYYKERPTWLRDNMGRKFVPIPEDLIPSDTKEFFKITARERSRPASAPLEDIIYRVPYSDKVLALRSGNYEISVIDRNKDVVAATTIHVK